MEELFPLTLQCVASASLANIPITALADADISAKLLKTVSSERNIQDFELCWTPCLSLFKLQHAMPAGTYTLVLNPFPASVYQLQAIESRNFTNDFTTSVDKPSAVAPADATKVRFNVVDMYFYCNTVDR